MTAAAASSSLEVTVLHPQGLDAIPGLWNAVDGLRTEVGDYETEHAKLHEREWARAADTAEALSRLGLAGLITVTIGTLLIGVGRCPW